MEKKIIHTKHYELFQHNCNSLCKFFEWSILVSTYYIRLCLIRKKPSIILDWNMLEILPYVTVHKKEGE